MNEKPELDANELDTTENLEIQEAAQPAAWYDSLVKLVKEFLEFNMKTYKTEKTPRL